MIRYARLWPPPWWRVVTRPALLRPPLLCSGRTSDFSGSVRVISTKSATLEPRRPGVVGLYLRIPMSDRPSEQVDAVACCQAHDRPLGVVALAEPEPGALALAGPVDGVDARDLDVEDLLDSDFDLRLVGVGADEERVLALVDEPV